MTCALGFRVHSGWAAMVTVAGSPTEPEVLDRRRIEIADPGCVQPYHMARELLAQDDGIAKARKFLERNQVAAQKLAITAIRQAMAAQGDRRVVACGMVVSSGRIPDTLEATLASHPSIHTAEGEFFREAILAAAGTCKLPVRRVKEKELFALAAAHFNLATVALQDRIQQLGKTLGSPWRQDEKYAALAAWLTL